MAAIKIKQGEEWVSLPMIGVTNFPDAPKDGKQYGRKDGTWAEIEAGTQYLDLSMFSSDSGTLSEEDYQKVVKAYEDGVNLFSYEISPGVRVFSNGSLSFQETSYNIIVSFIISFGADVIIMNQTIAINNDKSYSSTSGEILLNTNGSGTKALTDNGQYAEFAKPTKVVSGGSGTVSKELSPNTFYKFGEVITLAITFAREESGIENEYKFEFVSGSTPTTLSLPASVKWNGGKAPTIEASKTYQISVVNNFALIASF